MRHKKVVYKITDAICLLVIFVGMVIDAYLLGGGRL